MEFASLYKHKLVLLTRDTSCEIWKAGGKPQPYFFTLMVYTAEWQLAPIYPWFAIRLGPVPPELLLLWVLARSLCCFVVRGAGVSCTLPSASRSEVVGDRCGSQFVFVGSSLFLLLTTSSFLFWCYSSWSTAASSLAPGTEVAPCVECSTASHSCVKSNSCDKCLISLTVLLFLYLNPS